MGYKRQGSKDLHQQIKDNLRSKERFGESKLAAKRSGESSKYIYSHQTAHMYNRECQRFAEYVREHSPDGRNTSLEAARPYATEYIQMRANDPNISAYTVKMQASALGKLYDCKSTEFGYTGVRHREDITRSRERMVISEKTGKEILNPRTNAGHFSESRNRDIVEFARGTGLRRSELSELRGNQLVERDGRYYLDVTGKGGKERFAPVCGEHTQEIVERCREAGNNRVWDKVPAHMDVHHYRSQYATAMYKDLARERDDIPKSDRYCCRNDLKGVWYDKQAMKEVSEALGHNRISVIAEHYLRD